MIVKVRVVSTSDWKVGGDHFEKLYLKSELVNYYEKFGAKYIETLNNGEKLYYIEL